jgi:hypothetical protein
VLLLIYGEAMARVSCGQREGLLSEAGDSGDTAQLHNTVFRLA